MFTYNQSLSIKRNLKDRSGEATALNNMASAYANMYAGAPRVVASLWRKNDRATAELMRRFYVRMLRDRSRPAAALRAAQMSMLQEKRWQLPYYWAGILFQGE